MTSHTNGGTAQGMPQPAASAASGLVPMMVLLPEHQRAAMLGGGSFVTPPTLGQPSRLDLLYDDAMARFDAFCFWYARPQRSRSGMLVVAARLEAYGSAEALRIAAAVREALAEGR